MTDEKNDRKFDQASDPKFSAAFDLGFWSRCLDTPAFEIALALLSPDISPTTGVLLASRLASIDKIAEDEDRLSGSEIPAPSLSRWEIGQLCDLADLALPTNSHYRESYDLGRIIGNSYLYLDDGRDEDSSESPQLLQKFTRKLKGKFTHPTPILNFILKQDAEKNGLNDFLLEVFKEVNSQNASQTKSGVESGSPEDQEIPLKQAIITIGEKISKELAQGTRPSPSFHRGLQGRIGYHESGELPPPDFKFGPLVGNQEQLAKWILSNREKIT